MSTSTSPLSGPSLGAPVPAELLAAVAATVAAQLPAAQPLVPGPTGSSGGAPTAGTAVHTTFTGGTSGHLVVVVDPALEAALAAADGGPLPLAEAVAPVLAAAVAATGPAVAGAVEATTVEAALARPGLAWAPLVAAGGGDAVAWVGLALAGGSASSGGAAGGASVPAPRARAGLALLRDVEMVLTVELGRTRMSVRELLSLAPGSVVELDRAAGAPADLLVNGRLLARGEVVVVDEDYGLRITEIVEPGAED